MKCIGIYGATGSYDFGDYAMLIDNIEQFSNQETDVSFVIFSPNPKVTKICLEKNISEWLMKKIDIVEDYIEVSSVILRKGIRLFSRLSYEFIKYDYEYKKYLKIWEETKNGNIEGVLPCNLIRNLKKIDVMVFNGGGYLQNGWRNRNIQFMIYINALYALQKKIYFMANSVGPLDARYDRYVKESLELVEKIVIRDGKNYTYNFLDTPNLRDKIYIRTDDLMLLPNVYHEQVDKPYIIIEIMFFINRASKGRKYIIHQLEEFIKYVISQGKNVYLINLDKSDFIAKKCIKNICQNVNSHNLKCPISLEECISLDEVYKLYANAEFSVSMKYHPVIFSIRNNVPCLGIICDSDGYYRGKFFGAFESLGYNGEKNIIHLDDLTGELLIEKYNNRSDLAVDISVIDKLREERTKYIAEIFGGINNFGQ